jgi:predicted GNAT family acetyltransferase
MTSAVTKNETASRYELHVDGELVGIADYSERGDVVVIPHSEIDPSRRGQGLGAVLVQGALDDVRTAGRTVVPSCWYVAQFIDEHPAYKDLVAT